MDKNAGSLPPQLAPPPGLTAPTPEIISDDDFEPPASSVFPDDSLDTPVSDIVDSLGAASLDGDHAEDGQEDKKMWADYDENDDDLPSLNGRWEVPTRKTNKQRYQNQNQNSNSNSNESQNLWNVRPKRAVDWDKPICPEHKIKCSGTCEVMSKLKKEQKWLARMESDKRDRERAQDRDWRRRPVGEGSGKWGSGSESISNGPGGEEEDEWVTAKPRGRGRECYLFFQLTFERVLMYLIFCGFHIRRWRWWWPRQSLGQGTWRMDLTFSLLISNTGLPRSSPDTTPRKHKIFPKQMSFGRRVRNPWNKRPPSFTSINKSKNSSCQP
jgi:hypothetical protein